LFNAAMPESWLTVVGVVADIVQNDMTRQEFDPLVYVPYRQKPAASMRVFARTRVPPAGLVTAFRREVQALDADLPIFGPDVLSERLEAWNYWSNGMLATLFLGLAAIALLLASAGLYAVIAHSVGQRTQEIGIRLAIGATSRDILALVSTEGLLPLSVGLIVGLAASLAVNRVLSAALVHVSPADPIALAVASLTLMLSAGLGCLVPAARAMRVDPSVALRHD
jgi:putative ABC transport system permease protein